jgi:hypothetical protein
MKLLPPRFAVFLLGSWLGGCLPDFGARLSELGAPRIVGVVSEPAEAEEGGRVSLRALIAAPPSARTPAPSYQWCLVRKPLDELGPVSPTCLVADAAPDVAEALGAGVSVEASIPADACRRFGPRRPEAKAGEPAGRPVDPDPTGGYYQPLVTWLDPGALTLGGTRLDCGLAGVGRDVQLAFREQYRANENPAPTSFAIVRQDGSVQELSADVDAEPVELAPGEKVALELSWPLCPRTPVCGDGVCGASEDVRTCNADCATPHGCGGAESYAFYDPSTDSLIERRESLVASWYASAGSVDAEQSGQGESDPDGTATRVGFSAPAEAVLLKVWAVLRDDRGGASLSEGRLLVH